MNDLFISDIQPYMINIAAIKNKIPHLNITEFFFL